jgi:hypothetical protein
MRAKSRRPVTIAVKGATKIPVTTGPNVDVEIRPGEIWKLEITPVLSEPDRFEVPAAEGRAIQVLHRNGGRAGQRRGGTGRAPAEVIGSRFHGIRRPEPAGISQTRPALPDVGPSTQGRGPAAALAVGWTAVVVFRRRRERQAARPVRLSTRGDAGANSRSMTGCCSARARAAIT